ncbi:hypothetical protein D915_001643 [Fasciola hepatica]|uniref:C2H2-type domain-containing protein n=1 Tax=Fasciola hepatica TaxID=6192 RepID=A0A4E0S3J2_FASHE|nr:hypothetical protein D915_001643 [Fasciola hepatica]
MNGQTSNVPGSKGVSMMKHVVISATELNELPLSAYECDLCGLQVKTKANLRAHHIKTHRILKCKHSIEHNGGFASCSRLKQHFQNVHMSKSYACDRCGRRFPTPSAHEYHKKLCGNVYACSLCSKTYSVKKHLMQHFRRTGHCKVNSERSRAKAVANSGFCRGTTLTEISSAAAKGVSPVFSNKTTPIQAQPTTWIPVLILPVPVPAFTGWNGFHFGTNGTPSLESSVPPVMFPDAKFQLSTPKLQEAKSQPSLLQFPVEMVSQVYMNSQLSERSTQTARTDATVATQSYGTSVSVNIGTDEDDISAFLGSLFCDASVETTFPAAQLVHECTDTALDTDAILDSINPVSQYADAAFDTNDSVCSPTKPDYTEPPSPCILTAGDEKFPDHIVALTHEVNKVNQLLAPFSEDQALNGHRVIDPVLSVAQDSIDAQQTTYFLPPTRLLETPPPMRSQNSSQLLSIYHQPESSVMHHGVPSPPETACLTMSMPHGSDTHGIAEIGCQYPKPSVLRSDLSVCTTPDYLPSFQSIGLQSNLWSPTAPVYSSMETQTIDADLESWLNSVHTQTSTSPFDIHAFTDMGVGVNEDFLSAALDSVEADTKFPD